MNAADLLNSTNQALMNELEGVTAEDAENHFIREEWNLRDLLGSILANTKVLEELLEEYVLHSSATEEEHSMLNRFKYMKPEEFYNHHHQEYKYTGYDQIKTDLQTTLNHVNGLLSRIPKKEWEDWNVIPWSNEKVTIEDFIQKNTIPLYKDLIEVMHKFKTHIEEIKNTPSKNS